MKPKMARFIDYWAGNVICLAVSSIYNLSKIFPRKKNPPPPKNILLLELSEMGSAILSYPAIKLIKDRYPDARIYFWIFDKNADGVRILGIIPDERIITTRSSCLRLLVWDTLMNIVKIRKAGIDTVIDMELFSRFSSILVSAAGACRRAGFHRFSLEGLYRADVYTHKVMYNPHVHISRNFINLVNSLGEEGRSWALPRRPMEEWPLRLPAPKTDYQAQKMLHNKLITGNNRSVKCETIVVMNPGLDDALSIRKWPIENYAGLEESFA